MEILVALFLLLLFSIVVLKILFKIIEITWNNAFLLLILFLVVLLI